MDESDNYEPPTEEGEGKAVAIARAATVSLPVAGDAAGELIPLLFTAPLERRRQQWMKEVAGALSYLEENRGVRLDYLQSNESFITVLVQASQAAVRTHQQEKLKALGNAVTHSALGVGISEDLQLLFVRFVDELTPSHFVLLKFFNDTEKDFVQVKYYEDLFTAFNEQEAGHGITREEFKLLCEDLKVRVLLRISSSVDDFTDIGERGHVFVSEKGTPGPMLRVTDIGKKLLNYITK